MEILAESARRLAAAVVVQAICDSQGGDQAARDWLVTTGAAWLECLDIAPPSQVIHALESGKLPDHRAMRRKAAVAKRGSHVAANRDGHALDLVADVDRAAVRFLKLRGLYGANVQPMRSRSFGG